ncbi:MAG: hypothetical protein ACRDPE_21420 [Solirubrobacterales bacterium]
MAVALAGVFVLTVVRGVETLIAVCWVGAFGLIPGIDPNKFVFPNVKAYAFFFLLAAGLMLLSWCLREIEGKERWALPSNAVSIGLLGLVSYVVLVALGSHPSEVPDLTTPFLILPISGLVTILWCTHPEAIEGLRRSLPIVIFLLVLWSLAYDAGAAGCGPCRTAVGTEVTNTGLLGPGSRLYTSGQNSLLAFFVMAFAWSIYRPSALPISLTALGGVTIALQSSRAQYIAVAVAMVILVAWKFRQLPVGGRLALVLIFGLIVLALALSPVGHRAISAYTELHQDKGTGVYRLRLIEKTQENWTFFGMGFSTKSLNGGYDVDLGLPNTLLILGYLGAAIQLSLLGLGIWRGLKNASIIGVTIAAILLGVLVVRPSLPLLEYGHSAAMYGAILGLAATLVVPARRAMNMNQDRRTSSP